jgi:hypothetical protein
MPRKTRMYLPGIPAHVVAAPGILPLAALVRPARRSAATIATPVSFRMTTTGSTSNASGKGCGVMALRCTRTC